MHLFDLPNEILVATLSLLRTAEILPLTATSQRFHYLALRILHYRLLLAASNPLYKIILEAYLPSQQFSRPYLYCTYLGTDGLSSSIEGEGSMYADCLDDTGREIFGGRLAKLGGLYSRFRPEYPGVQGQMPLRRIAGAAPNVQSNNGGLQSDWYGAIADNITEGSSVGGSVTTMSASVGIGAVGNDVQDTTGVEQSDVNLTQQASTAHSQPIWTDYGDGGTRKVIDDFHFDEDELFGQFCIAASLVRQGPRRGVFLSSLQLCTDKQDVMRVWREWLIERSRSLAHLERSGRFQPQDRPQRTSTTMEPEYLAADPSILWTDYKKNIGLRLLVREKQVEGIPMRSPDEEKEKSPLSFSIEIQGELGPRSRLIA